jgi:hypothetical protein
MLLVKKYWCLINITRHVIGKKNPCESLEILMQNGRKNDGK